MSEMQVEILGMEGNAGGAEGHAGDRGQPEGHTGHFGGDRRPCEGGGTPLPSPVRVNAPLNSSWVFLPAASAQQGLCLGKFLQAAAPATFPHSPALPSPGTLPPSLPPCCCLWEMPLSPQTLHRAPFFGGAKETPQHPSRMLTQKGRKAPKTSLPPARGLGCPQLAVQARLGNILGPEGCFGAREYFGIGGKFWGWGIFWG